jgi:hypothetical protein
MAAYFHGWPHEIWAFPYHYFVALRHEYLKIVNPQDAPDGRDIKDLGGYTIETIHRE